LIPWVSRAVAGAIPALLGTVALALGVTVASVTRAHADTSITIDGGGTGQTFDGIGARVTGYGTSAPPRTHRAPTARFFDKEQDPRNPVVPKPGIRR
jgi:hypothetical protein